MSLRTLENSYQPPHSGGAVQRVSHQFEDIDQQNESYIVGMWTFLVTEVMFFGALFLAYSVYRVLYYENYIDAHRFLSVPLGTINTGVLLTSSFTMVLGVYAAQKGNGKGVIAALLATIVLSFGFLGIKYVEYTSKINEGLFPGSGWNYTLALEEDAKHHGGGAKAPTEAVPVFNAAPKVGMNSFVTPVTNTIGHPTLDLEAQKEETRGRRARLFFSIYFTMTGLHGVHVLVGILLMTIIIILVAIKHPSVDDYMPTEMVGLYWHFVDIVWIFLFPLMYLIS